MDASWPRGRRRTSRRIRTRSQDDSSLPSSATSSKHETPTTPRAEGARVRLFAALSGLLLLLGAGTVLAAQDPEPANLYSEGLEQLTQENWEEAVRLFEAVLEVEPDHVPSLFNLARALGSAGENVRAIETYRRLLEIDDVFEARMNLAILLSGDGRFQEGLEEATWAVALRNDDPAPALLQARLLDQLGRTDEAITAFRHVLALDPDLEAPRSELANLFLRAGRLAEARSELEELANRGAGNAGIFASLGDIAVEQGRLEEANERYRQAIEMGGEDTDLLLRLALVLHELGDYAGAIPLLETLPGQSATLAEAYLLAGRFENSRDAYERLVLENPNAADFWLGLGRSHYELGDVTSALAPLMRAVELDPTRASAWGMIGAIYHQQGDFAGAVPMLQHRLDLLPEDAVTHFLLATALDNLGDFERALLHYSRFLELDDGSNDARTFQVQQRRDSLERVLVD